MSQLPKTYSEARWLNDLDPSGAETDSDLESLIQDIFHIIVQIPGSNGADPHKGVGVVNYLSGPTNKLLALPALIDAQLRNVSRITSSRTTIAPVPGSSPPAYIIAIAAVVAARVVNFNYQLGPNGLSVVPGGG